jgi:hypothetical protein
MKIIGSKIFLEFYELVEKGVSENTIKNAIYTGAWESKKDEKDKRKVLIAFDSIPAATQKKLGGMEAIIERQKLKEIRNRLKAAELDIEFFYKELENRMLGEDDAYDIAASYAFSKSLIELYEACKTNNDYSLLISRARHEALLMMLKVAEANKYCGLQLGNVKSLDKKLSLIRKNGYQVLISHKFGNQNTRKVDEKMLAILGELYANSKFGSAKIHRELNKKLKEQGMKEIAIATVRHYINDPEFQHTYLRDRDGKRAWQNKFEPIITRKPPSRAGMLWNIDGTPIEIYMKYKNVKGIWTAKRLYAVFVIDAYSWKIVGAGIHNGNETRELIMTAIKDAVYKENYKPHQLLYDNTRAIGDEMEKWMREVASYAFPAEAGNAKSKVIEPLFKHFFENQAKEWINFSGLGIKSKQSSSHINEEFVRKNLMKFPEEEEAIRQIREMIESWNNDPISAGPARNRIQKGIKLSPAAAQENSLTVHRDSLETFSMERKIDLFWVWRLKDGERQTYTPTNNGISVRFPNGEKKTFEIMGDDMSMMQQYISTIGKSVHIKYDPTDYSMIAVYLGDRYLTLAAEKEEIPMALGDMQEGDGEKRAAKQEKKRAVATKSKEKREEAKDLVADIINPEDVLKGGFGATTSTQHKDRLNEAEDAIKDVFDLDLIYN